MSFYSLLKKINSKKILISLNGLDCAGLPFIKEFTKKILKLLVLKSIKNI